MPALRFARRIDGARRYGDIVDPVRVVIPTTMKGGIKEEETGRYCSERGPAARCRVLKVRECSLDQGGLRMSRADAETYSRSTTDPNFARHLQR